MKTMAAATDQARNQDFAWEGGGAFWLKLDFIIIVVIKQSDWDYRVNKVVKVWYKVGDEISPPENFWKILKRFGGFWPYS